MPSYSLIISCTNCGNYDTRLANRQACVASKLTTRRQPISVGFFNRLTRKDAHEKHTTKYLTCIAYAGPQPEQVSVLLSLDSPDTVLVVDSTHVVSAFMFVLADRAVDYLRKCRGTTHAYAGLLAADVLSERDGQTIATVPLADGKHVLINLPSEQFLHSCNDFQVYVDRYAVLRATF